MHIRNGSVTGPTLPSFGELMNSLAISDEPRRTHHYGPHASSPSEYYSPIHDSSPSLRRGGRRSPVTSSSPSSRVSPRLRPSQSYSNLTQPPSMPPFTFPKRGKISRYQPYGFTEKSNQASHGRRRSGGSLSDDELTLVNFRLTSNGRTMISSVAKEGQQQSSIIPRSNRSPQRPQPSKLYIPASTPISCLLRRTSPKTSPSSSQQQFHQGTTPTSTLSLRSPKSLNSPASMASLSGSSTVTAGSAPSPSTGSFSAPLALPTLPTFNFTPHIHHHGAVPRSSVSSASYRGFVGRHRRGRSSNSSCSSFASVASSNASSLEDLSPIAPEETRHRLEAMSRRAMSHQI